MPDAEPERTQHGMVAHDFAGHGYRGEMTSVKAQANRPDDLYAPVGTDPRAYGRFQARATGHVIAADPRWLKFGIAAALGVLTGTMLFATEAHGRTERRLSGRPDQRP